MRIPSVLFLSVPVFTQKVREPNQVSKPGELKLTQVESMTHVIMS